MKRKTLPTSFTVDYRCPRCNQPLIGDESVVVRQVAPPPGLICPKCKKVAFRRWYVDDIGGAFSYEAKGSRSLQPEIVPLLDVSELKSRILDLQAMQITAALNAPTTREFDAHTEELARLFEQLLETRGVGKKRKRTTTRARATRVRIVPSHELAPPVITLAGRKRRRASR